MNQKQNDGIILRRSVPKDAGKSGWLLQGVSALVLFVGVVGPLGAFCGLWEILPPAVPFACGVAVILMWMALCAAGKDKWFFHGLLGLLLVAALLGRKPLADGACLAWNQFSSTWTALTGRVIPLLLAETGNEQSCLVFFALVSSVVLAIAACVCGRCCRTAAAILLPLMMAAVCIGVGAEFSIVWFAIPLLASLYLLLCSGWSAHSGDAGGASLLGLAAVLPVVALLVVLAQHPACRQWTEQMKQRSETAVHAYRYETGHEALPEGDFSKPLDGGEGYTALQVTMEIPERLFLRGFTGDTFRADRWEMTENRLLEEYKETLYWLYEDHFYPQGQLASAAQTVQSAVETQWITVRNINGCSELYFVPHTLAAESFAALRAEKLGQSAVKTAGLHGERLYTYQILCGGTQIPQETLEGMQGRDDPAVVEFRQAESAYREVVRATDLRVPESFVKALGELLDACCEPHGSREELTVAQAQASALDFLTLCFGDSGLEVNLPLEQVEGSTYQYATAAALALRYYGIPARYAEGYEITADMAAQAESGEEIQVSNSCARAWVEVYQDGIGWMPMELTPGFEALAPQKGENGVAPVGVGGVDPDSQIGSAAGTENGVTLSQGMETEPDSTQQKERSPLFSGGGTVTRIAKALPWILLLLLTAAVIFLFARREWTNRRRRKLFMAEDVSEAIGWIYADAAGLLSAMGLDRSGGSMELVCNRAAELDASYGDRCRQMTKLNQEALFSSHKLQESQRQAVLDFHGETLQRLRNTMKWHRRLWMQWGLCLY